MRPVTRTISAVAISDPVRVDWRGGMSNFNLNIAVVLSAGAVLTYSGQFSLDNPQTFTDATDYNTNATWFDMLTLDMISGSDSEAITNPVQAVRLNVTAHTSGSATMTALQSN